MRTCLVAASILFVALIAPPRAAAPAWHITATVAESCSCTISCPCNFGGEPNRNPCEGNRLIAIKSGHYEDVDLAGVSFLVTFTMRNVVEGLRQRQGQREADGRRRGADADRVRRLSSRHAVVHQGADHDEHHREAA